MHTGLRDDISPKITDFRPGFNSRIIDKTLLENQSGITITPPKNGL
jgi:hypothetical protein